MSTQAHDMHEDMQGEAADNNLSVSSAHIAVFGAPEGQDARYLADQARKTMAEDKVLVHVALDDHRASSLKDLLDFFAPDIQVLSFPAWDCLPYDRVSPHNDIVAQRMAALAQLISWKNEAKRCPRILLTTVNAAYQRVPPRSAFDSVAFTAVQNGRVDMESLQSFLQSNGYVRTDTVREAGEYAIRGGIVDLYPSGYELPVRMDLFGDEVESIRLFDPITQRTEKKIKEFSLTPATEFFLNEESIVRFRSSYRERFGVVRGSDPLYEAVSEGRRYNGMDHWLPLFFDHMDTLFDYVPAAMMTLDQHADQSRVERHEQIVDFYQARKTLEEATETKIKARSKDKETLGGTIYRPLHPSELYVTSDEWDNLFGGAQALYPFGAPDQGDLKIQQYSADGKKGRDFADIRALPDGDVLGFLRKYMDEHRKDGRKILIAVYGEGSRDRLLKMMEHAGFTNFVDVKKPDDLKKLSVQQIGISILALDHGFIAPDLCVISEQDILGDRLARKSKKRAKADNFLKEVSSLVPGDLVVHIDHGVGRFDSLETVKAAGTHHDCLKIIYAGDDKLFVPVENIEILSRFGSDEGTIQLDKLGGAGWQARKSKVKKDLMIMADQLLKIAAERALNKAEPLRVEASVYDEFAARFPYEETEDQQRSIQNVLDDLGQDKPMDRLVCGDVGFGKTEVAIRAAYVAAMNGTQVALVVPTTLLARQHYENFEKRFRHTGIRVEQLSRLVPVAHAKQVRDGMRDGTVNIVIGTHSLLAKTVKFAHLGLLIVDEEQRFGVKQKESLKELKSNVHVLTLTATPIPRTLQLALTGVREMSLITTPPIDRLAIRTFVLPYDPMVVREALLREHYRGGQSFYVCPRVKDMADLEKELKELVPEVSVIAAHGQMTPAELEDRMTAFYDGQYDVLLATNIIESGIDIPTANTMIVHRSEMFGLAQLYQIRGRIGRSKMRAYAYLTHDPVKKLTDQGQKRLEVIETLDTLGAGFQLASHDMDIRGSGNLLGDKQSGHVKEVGVELYQQMLEEAVAATREGLDWNDTQAATQSNWSPQINIGLSVLIPDHYVEDLTLRMSLYRRLSDLQDKDEIESFAAELIDRFGKLPDEVENLLKIVEIKQFCKRAGIDKVEAGPKGAVIGFYQNKPPNVDGLMRWLQEKGGAIKLRPDQKLVAIRGWDSVERRVQGVRSLTQSLASLS